jgi:D-sedoheptulose 7-phosphate isomerase
VSVARALADAAITMAARLRDGGRIWAVAPGLADHARHLAVEFVHPASVGASAMPAVALVGGDPAADLARRSRPGDVLVTIGDRDGASLDAAARQADGSGLLHVHLGWGEPPGVQPNHVALDDARGAGNTECLLTRAHHVLWELCFVATTRGPSTSPSAGHGPSFLYPHLGASSGVDAVELAGLAAAAWAEGAALDRATLASNGPVITAVVDAIRATVRRRGRVLAIGNGGSATDAARLVRLLAPAIDAATLDDPAVVTALANDVGAGRIFERQIEVHAGHGDTVVAFSTSGRSANIIGALSVARRLGSATVACAGYDGGALADHRDVDHCIAVASSSVHRIQEAHGAVCDRIAAALACTGGAAA